MNESLKKNFPLIVAFGLPLLFVLGVAIFAFLPSFLLSTRYDFVYAVCTEPLYRYQYDCSSKLQDRFSVENNKLSVHETAPVSEVEQNDFRIIYHDTLHNTSREITLAEARTLSLNGLITSDDGVTVSGGRISSPDVFPFYFGGSSYGYFLTKGNSRSELNLIYDVNNYYYNNFKFIGWVLPGRN